MKSLSPNKLASSSASSGTTLPTANDGQSLIQENGQWVAGPVIGGVSYLGSAPTDSNFSSVELLLLGDGTNGSTSITDTSNAARTVTVNGNTQISTAKVKAGTGSIYFDGTSPSCLKSAGDSDLLNWFSNGAYTLEAWIYADSWTNWTRNFCGNHRNTSSFDVYWSFGPRTDGTLSFEWINSNFSYSSLNGTTALTTGVWNHIAMSYDGTTLRLFVNGNVDASVNTGTTGKLTSDVLGLVIGGKANVYIEGYVDDFRITQGFCRYTSNFTPTTIGGSLISIPYSIDKLEDVDTSTVAPTDGQALVWDNTASKWEPGSIAAGASTAQATAITLLFS